MKNLGTIWRKQPMSVYVKFNKITVMFSKRDCHNQYLTIEVCPFWIAAWLLNNLTSLFRQGLCCSWKLEDPGGKTTWKILFRLILPSFYFQPLFGEDRRRESGGNQSNLIPENTGVLFFLKSILDFSFFSKTLEGHPGLWLNNQ